jgi:hypothetical protein
MQGTFTPASRTRKIVTDITKPSLAKVGRFCVIFLMKLSIGRNILSRILSRCNMLFLYKCMMHCNPSLRDIRCILKEKQDEEILYHDHDGYRGRKLRHGWRKETI